MLTACAHNIVSGLPVLCYGTMFMQSQLVHLCIALCRQDLEVDSVGELCRDIAFKNLHKHCNGNTHVRACIQENNA